MYIFSSNAQSDSAASVPTVAPVVITLLSLYFLCVEICCFSMVHWFSFSQLLHSVPVMILLSFSVAILPQVTYSQFLLCVLSDSAADTVYSRVESYGT